MKRPVLMAAIGYIIGIIEGLYLHISIVPLYVCIAAIYSLIHILVHSRKINLWKITRYFRYIKLYINNHAIIILLIASIISNITVHKLEKTYTELQKQLNKPEEIALIGMIASPVTQKEYEQVYTLKIDYAICQGKKTNIKDLSVYIHNKGTSNNTYQYGDIVEVKGSFETPEGQRNYGGFDYNMYLKTEKVLGNIKISQIELISDINSTIYNNLPAHNTPTAQNTKATDLEKAHKNILTILQAKATKMSQTIQQRICKILPTETSSILIGLLLGDTQYIEEDVLQNFRNANISHILAVSGMHMSYLILIAMAVFNKPLGKRKAYILSIILILAYMFITGFSPSIVRAGIMGILLTLSKLIHKCNDVFTNISISVLVILLNNPYTILNLGFQLSFGGTIGIVLFNRFISKILKKWIKGKLLEMISVTISAQMIILPISIFHFNTISPYFLITNLLIGITIGPIMVCGLGFLILVLMNTNLAITFAWMIEIPIRVLIWISEFGKLPFSCIYIPTPHLWHISLYFILLILFISLYRVYKAKYVTNTIIRFRNVIALIKFYIKHRMSKNNKRRLIYLMILVVVFLSISKIISNNLEIHFVDVGQGDCTFIETPHGKTILIDGGGSENYDVGKKTLMPYILDRGYTKIDIIIVSHFDTDHMNALCQIMKNLKVKNVIIGKQFENSENLQKFLKIAKKKKVKVNMVKAGDKIPIEKNLYFQVLWPDSSNIISEKVLNNNALVCKLCYKNFSMLFTGDIEEVAEKELIKRYSNTNTLNSTVLKVAHHGSKTSSIKEFVNLVKPKIAMIGVGKNNLYRHPSSEVIERLNNMRSKNF